MANHKSSKKRARQTGKRRIQNRYTHRTTRSAVRALRATTDKAAALVMMPRVMTLLDKLAKTGVIHDN
ncbi:MAG: 30S ribosomal protein S20, partial [Mucinivorans sp.]